MRLLALTVATTTMLTFASPLTAQVRPPGSDDGAVGRPLQLDGGPSLGSDNHGQTGSRSEAAEPSASSKKSQIDQIADEKTEKTGETAIGGRSKTHGAWRFRSRHRFAMHKRNYHAFAFHMPRHRFVIHRRRFVAVNEFIGV